MNIETPANLAEFIIQIESYNANIDIDIVKRAYVMAEKAHATQFRSSGHRYIEHCIQVAFTLAELHMDSATIAAGMIHDVVEDTEVTLETLRSEFGDEVADLVDGVTKIGAMRFESVEEQQVEYFRKMLLSMAKDIRVILIKVADRLHNMRTLEYVPVEKQRRIAEETRDVYCPLAHRLGINKAKIELEDLVLKFLDPEVYNDLAQKIAEKRDEREGYIKTVVGPIKDVLSKDGIIATVYGRAKHLYSIYRKIRVRGVLFEEIYDLTAFRVIVNSERECYHALGIIHAMWKPVAGRFHDYIANPKPNGYRSLHTTVFGPQNKKVEIQIRTHQMHYVAENGIAAHWLYKEGRQELSRDDRQMIWLRDILEWQKDLTNPTEFLEYLKIDLYSEDIFVFTPNNKLVHLPRGATPLDFAFQIHTEIGFHCSGAKINNRLMPLSTELKSGDIVEIITNQNRSPSRDWLKLARTSSARSRIRRWLKQAGYDQFVKLGKEILTRRLKEERLKMPDEAALSGFAETLGKKSTSDMFAAFGNGSLAAGAIMPLIRPADEKQTTGLVGRVLDRIRRSKGIKVQGLDDMLFRFAGCCQPVPGDDIIGFITRGRGVTIHQADCPVTKDLERTNPERKIAVSWEKGAEHSFVVQLEMLVEDRKHMLRDISQVISELNTNLRAAEMISRDTMAIGKFVVEVTNLTHLNRVIDKVRKIRGVSTVRRSRSWDASKHESDDLID